MTKLKTGWTTGCCAALAAKAAAMALLRGAFPARVSLRLPQGQVPCFSPEQTELGDDFARCGIRKDAGDDPDVTHGALVVAHVRRGEPGQGILYRAGEGVGTVTRKGLPLAVGEPAINPAPRRMIEEAVSEVMAAEGRAPDLTITISVPGGEALAEKTWNPRLGIIGGLSILGTTGIVRPYSCAAWIASIHRGIDVARAESLTHIIAATGNRSEAVARARHELPEIACIDMGDFVGGTLKYLRRHPVPRLTLAGGVAKFTKLALGAMDLHSKRSPIDFTGLRHWLAGHGLTAEIAGANTVLEVYEQVGAPYARLIAREAQARALAALKGAPVEIELLVVDREGNVLAVEEFRA